MEKRKPKDPVKNRADVARHTLRKHQRINAILADVLHYMKRTPVNDDDGNMKGYMITFDFPDDAYDRFEKLAKEHGRTAKQLMHETMEIYFQELQRLKDEQN